MLNPETGPQQRAVRSPSAGGLRAAFAAMSGGVMVHSADGRILMANPAAGRLLGCDATRSLDAGSIGRHVRAVRPDGSPLPAQELPWTLTLRTGVPQRAVILGIGNPARDAVRWLQAGSVPLSRAGHRFGAVVTTLTDVTAARSGEALLGAVIAATRDGMVVVDRALRITSANGAAAATLGVDPSALVGAGIDVLWPGAVDAHGAPLHPDRRPPLAVLATGRPERDVVIGIERPAGGDRTWLVASCEPLGMSAGTGTPEAALVTLTDITRLKEAEEALRVSERRFRSLHGYQADAVLRMSPSGGVLSASPSVWRVLRFDPNDPPQLAGRIHPDDAAAAQEAFRRMAGGEMGVRFTARVRRGDGRWIWAEVVGGPVYDDAGELLEVQQSIRDVSDREHHERDHTALRRITVLLAQGARIEDVLPEVARAACSALPADTVRLVRFAGPRAETVARHPRDAGDEHSMDLARPGNDAAGILSRGIAAGVHQIRPIAGPGPRALRGVPKGMTVAVPVVLGRELWGCLWAGLAEGDFAEGAVERLRAFGDLVAVVALAGRRRGPTAGE